jgi:hypothetical protein
MCSSIIKIIYAILFMTFCVGAHADLSEHETKCTDIGFKKKTPAYGECVLELDRRSRLITTRQISEVQKPSTPLSEDQEMCIKFGFALGSDSFSDCRLKIEIAKRENEQRQATYDIQKQRYEEEKRRYDAQLAEYQKEKDRQKGLALLRFGAALAGGTSPYASENLANASRQSLGIAPNPPSAPQIQNFTIRNPSGRMINCSAFGTNINCF